jgi:hypothetical protein
MREARPVDASAIASADDAEKAPLLESETPEPDTATPVAPESDAMPLDVTTVAPAEDMATVPPLITEMLPAV